MQARIRNRKKERSDTQNSEGNKPDKGSNKKIVKKAQCHGSDNKTMNET